MPVAYIYNGLIRAVGSELCHRRPDDAGLTPRIVKIDRVRTFLCFHVVNAAKEVIGMAVRAVRGSRGVDVGPTSRNLELRWSNAFSVTLLMK